jgi:hypothetical protein
MANHSDSLFHSLKSQRSLIVFTIFFGWAVSCWIRLTYASFGQVTSDTLSPFVGGIQWWNFGLFQPANPESDQWLWILSLPLMYMSQSLTELFWWKCVATTIVVPISMWMCFQWTTRHRIFWMLVLAMILTFDMGLVDTMLSSFRGYWAPECMAVACLGLMYWDKGQSWGAHFATVWTVIAMGQHPLVLGCLPALFWLWVSMKQRGQRWWISVLLACLCTVPRIVWLWNLSHCDAGGWACFTGVASSSSESLSIWSMLSRVLIDRLWVEMGFASIIMIVGWWYSSNRVLKVWLLCAVVGITLLGLSISTLRPYHYRVLIVPMLLLSVDGCSRLGMKGWLAGVCWCSMVLMYRIEPVGWFNTTEEADGLARELCEQSEPIWLEGYGESLQVSPQSVGLSLLLQGCQTTMAKHPTPRIWVVEMVNNPSEVYGDVVWQDSDCRMKHVAKEEWLLISSDQKWSGHDVAILEWDPSVVNLEW